MHRIAIFDEQLQLVPRGKGLVCASRRVVSHAQTKPATEARVTQALQTYTVLELFCGTAWVSRMLKLAGHSVASFDILLGDPLPGKQDAMNLLSDAGFALLGSQEGLLRP